MANRVRVNAKYYYNPVMMDRLNPPYGNPAKGQEVRVVNKHGCPPANTMGMCYIESTTGEFLGMVCTNSLQREPVKADEQS